MPSNSESKISSLNSQISSCRWFEADGLDGGAQSMSLLRPKLFGPLGLPAAECLIHDGSNGSHGGTRCETSMGDKMSCRQTWVETSLKHFMLVSFASLDSFDHNHHSIFST